MPLSNLIDLNINNVKITFHALTRFQESDLKVREVFKALRTKFQIIEEYTDDPRGSSALLLLFIEEDPIHLVVAPHNAHVKERHALEYHSEVQWAQGEG